MPYGPASSAQGSARASLQFFTGVLARGGHRPPCFLRPLRPLGPLGPARAFSVMELLEGRVLMSTVAPLDINGVQPVALDQPQIHTILRTSPGGDPLGSAAYFDAYLDTGTSGTLLSQETADALGVTATTVDGQPVQFTDIGIGGGEAFNVSDPLYGSLAPYTTLFPNDIPIESFNQSFGPTRLELNTQPADALLGPLDIMGMPAMQGKVMVLDPSALAATDPNQFDSLRTYLYTPGTPFNADTASSDPGIPTTNYHVKLSYGDFSRFTTVTPVGADAPTLEANPFFGPNPLTELDPSEPAGNSPPITITQGTASASGSFLFDTGAGASFISQALAGQVGVHYKAGTYDTDNPVLLDASGNALPNQFVLPLGGIGGTLNAAGFYLSSMTVPTQEGQPIRFVNAPVLVADVTVADPATGKTLTLDGDFGMNFLVPSLDVSGLTGASSGGTSSGTTSDSSAPFDWVTFDQKAGVLGLDVVGVTAPPSLVGGVAASNATSVTDNQAQRSEVRNLTVSFSEPVTLGSGAFTLQMLNTGGSGANDGSAPTDASVALGTPVMVAGSNGTQWSIPVLGNTAFSDSTGSLTDGTYQVVVNASAVTATADGTAMVNNFTTPTFHRLYGDLDGNGSVNALDYAKFKSAFGSATGATNYNADLDFDANGAVNALDYAQFKKRFGLTLTD